MVDTYTESDRIKSGFRVDRTKAMEKLNESNSVVSAAISDVLDLRVKDGRGKYIKKNNLVFPTNIGETNEFIRFEVYKEYIFDRKESTQSDVISTIFLPLPQNLQTNYGVSYSQDLGTVGYGAAKAASALYNKDDTTEFSIGSILAGLGNLGAQGLLSGGGDVAAGGVAGKAVGAVLGAVGQPIAKATKGAMLGTGIAVNPHQAQIFENVHFRSHTFSYKFSPKSYNESVMIKDIVKVLKLAMHPTYFGHNHFFDYPFQFDIDIMNVGNKNEFMFDVGPSVLTIMNVDYAPDGPYFHYEGGQKIPVSVALSLTFVESQILTQESIDEENY